MKTLSECKIDHKVKVLKLNASKELKQRLISFGIMRGTTAEILKYAPGRSTMEIKVGKMKIALRTQEANLIEVETI
ncbi:MAG: ferrous iron transport protein A [Sulfurimonas sp.]|nr:ferrous iron transport protein A [Sulfurimonas sp.]